MRVTGGAWRSRRLRGPTRGAAIRPTPDAMRERVFAILGERVIDARFLDLFSGTGVVAIEALSRGARSVVVVEKNRAASRIAAANLAALGVGADRARLAVQPASRAVELLAREGLAFDLAWADPPFESWRDGVEAIRVAFERVLTDRAIVCLECPARADVAVALSDDLAVERDVRGGASRVVIIGRRELEETR